MNITSLPDDALCEIFDCAIPFYFHGDEVLNHEAPFNISHTCRAWRQLVLSDSRCWVLILYALKHSSLKVDIRILSLLLERSAGALIKFKIDKHCIQGPLGGSDLLAIHIIATGKQSRWLKMALRYPRECRDAVRPAELHDLSNLTEWKIADVFPFGLEAHRESQSPLFVVPIRRTTDYPIAPLLSRLSLLRFRANCEEQRGVLAMLRQCPNLIVLRISFDSEQPGFDEIDEPGCLMEKLQALTVDGNFKYLHLFYKIKAPSLGYLLVDGRYGVNTSGLKKELLKKVVLEKREERVREALSEKYRDGVRIY